VVLNQRLRPGDGCRGGSRFCGRELKDRVDVYWVKCEVCYLEAVQYMGSRDDGEVGKVI